MNQAKAPQYGADTFHLPIVPYSAIDLCNRRAAATGSIGYAMATASANYNGHRVGVSWNDYRGYWIAEHYWGERVVWCRGSLADCLQVAKEYHARGDKGAEVVAHLDARAPETLDEQRAACERAGYTPGDQSKDKAPWWTPKHDAVAEAFTYEKWWPGIVGVACNLKDGEAWSAARDAYLNRNRRSPSSGRSE